MEKKKRSLVTNLVGNDKYYTIFDELTESLEKKDQKKSVRDRSLKYVYSPLIVENIIMKNRKFKSCGTCSNSECNFCGYFSHIVKFCDKRK